MQPLFYFPLYFFNANDQYQVNERNAQIRFKKAQIQGSLDFCLRHNIRQTDGKAQRGSFDDTAERPSLFFAGAIDLLPGNRTSIHRAAINRDFPAPDGPIIAAISPSAKERFS